jgi:hypothetical protein
MTSPRASIPAGWAARGACPVCGAAPLTLAQPDQLACPRCGTAFQLEAGGPRLRLVRLPAEAGPAADGQWRTAAEARAWVRGLILSRRPAARLEAGRADAVPADALAQAQGLFALRHTPPQIERILLSSRAWTPEQVAAVLEALQPAVAAAQARQRRQAWVLAGMGLGTLTAALVLGAWVMSMFGGPGPASATPGPEGGAASAPTAASGLPAGLQTLVPPGARLVNPTPVIRRGVASGAPQASACPRTPEAAAGLFGGAAGDWRYDEANRGWMLFSGASLITVRVPANMVAGYMEFGQNLSVSQVDGPATLDGVNLVVISCE